MIPISEFKERKKENGKIKTDFTEFKIVQK